MQNKKQEWQRIGIYLLLSYATAYIPEFIFGWKMGDYENWTDPKMLVWFLIVTFSPALSVVLTRLITKEDWKDSFLHINLKGNLKYYLMPVFLPVLLSVWRGVTINLMIGESPFSGFTLLRFSGIFLMTTACSIPLSFINFGEELGWRGYLYPKLEKLIGIPKTVITGGIIWGLWHAPLTAKGHNFGTEYPLFPYLGFVMMSIFCIGLGAFLMYLTKKTNSVYPASIGHSINNNAVGAVAYTFVPEDFDPENYSVILQFQHHWITLGFLLVTAVLFTAVMLKENKNQKIPAET